MRFPEHWEGWAAAALVLGVGLWLATGGQHVTWPATDEDVQYGPAAPPGLPSDFVHWSPVSWAGRDRPYPSAWCGQIPALINRSVPDFADEDS